MIFERRHKVQVQASEILGFFQALIDCGRERASFPDVPARTAPELMAWVLGEVFPWWLILADGKPAGCAYITEIRGRCGRCHFAFLPVADPLKMGRFILSSVLYDQDQEGRYIMDTLVGVTPASNKAAATLAEKCGVRMLGMIPDFYYVHDTAENQPAVIAYYTRDWVQAEWGDSHGQR